MKSIRAALAAFGTFWWEFLVGDTPELLAATIIVVGVALALRHHPTAGFIAVPLVTSVALVLSTLRGRDRRSRRS